MAFHYVASLVTLAVVVIVGGVGGGAALASPLVCTLYAFVALSKLLALNSGACQKHLTFANVDNLHCPMPRAINLTPPRPATSTRPHLTRHPAWLLATHIHPRLHPHPFTDSIHKGESQTQLESRVAL